MLKVYNTLSRRLEPFEPLRPGIVKMYVCGPTVYDYSHLGHARTYVAFDVIKRYLRLKGYDVFHVQNITDIDDKIIKRAQERGVSWKEIADYYTRDYLEALEKLNITVHVHPRVTEHISDIIEFIQALIDKGYAYVAPSGSVYFEVDKYPYYGELSKRFEKEQWRQETDVLSEKKKPYDFALWKAAKPGEPWWDSPWGRGRPGWHIECSVMSSKYLGEQFDIHGGGQDLIFPHHENERAQSEARFGKRPWVKYWIHTGYLTISGEKMSKSLGNIIVLREAFKEFDPKVIRLWLSTVHYRKPVDFSDKTMEQYGKHLERLIATVELLKKKIKETSFAHRLREEEIKTLIELEDTRTRFYEAMDDDFNASGAFSQVYRLTNIVFRDIQYSEYKTLPLRAYQILYEFNQVLGVLDEYFHEKPVRKLELVDQLIDLIVRIRGELRRRKLYELSDTIRSELADLGIQLMDKGDKTTWIIREK